MASHLTRSLRCHLVTFGEPFTPANHGRKATGRSNTSRFLSPRLVQKVLGLCTVPLGAKADEPCKTNPQFRRRKGARRKCESSKGCGRNWKLEVSWLRKGCGTSPKKRMLEDREEPCPRGGREIWSDLYKAMHEESFVSSWAEGGCRR